MTINRKTFSAYARRAPFGGKLSTAQVNGCRLGPALAREAS